jgi:hypothetical protein
MKACPLLETTAVPPNFFTTSKVFHVSLGSCTIFPPGFFLRIDFARSPTM